MDFLGTGASSDEGESDGPIIRATMNISSVPSVSVGQRTNRYQDAPYATAPVKNVPYQKQVTELIKTWLERATPFPQCEYWYPSFSGYGA